MNNYTSIKMQPRRNNRSVQYPKTGLGRNRNLNILITSSKTELVIFFKFPLPPQKNNV